MIVNEVEHEREKTVVYGSQLEANRENMFNELKLLKSKSRNE